MSGQSLFTPEKKKGKKVQMVLVLGVFAIALSFSAYRLASVFISQDSGVTESGERISRLFPSDEATVGGDVTVIAPVIEGPQRPERRGDLPPEEQFSAKAIIVKDLESGALLYNKNAYTARPIASLTKLMSALVMLEKPVDWSQRATVIGADSLGTHMYAGDTYTLEELWQAGLVASSNKAVMTFTNAIGWPEEAVVERMSQKARELGMTQTVFTDTTGLDAGNVASASDIAVLLEEALSHEKIKEALLVPEVTLYSNERQKEHHMYSTNWLLLGWIQHPFAQIIGGKTGYTPEAGYNFAFQVYNDAGHGVSVVVLGTESHEARFTEARDIAQWAFEHHEWPQEKDTQVNTSS